MAKQVKQDMIFEILSLLPLKSVVRFKAVSKQWCNVISDYVFARAHFKHQDVSSFILQIDDKSNPRISIIDVKEAEKANSRGEFFQPLIMPFPTVSSVHFQNCCDGILCISFVTSGCILLWNPITKWTKEIDYPHKRDDVETNLVGFGYDSSIRDYKVVRISPMHIEVFNLKSNAWRRVSNVFPKRLWLHLPPVYLNGNLYWKNENMKSEDLIIRFDLKEEKLSIVQNPKEEMELTASCELTSFRGMLCLMHKYSEPEARVCYYKEEAYETVYEILVMKEENNWIKVMENRSGYIPMCCIHEAIIFRRDVDVDGRAPFIVSSVEKGENYC